jgi:L-alanine-DL-glutamate epimerase-like enolase superfamily enzyme
MEYQPVMLQLANRFLKTPMRCENGKFTLPNKPGLGIEIDENSLARYAREYVPSTA